MGNLPTVWRNWALEGRDTHRGRSSGTWSGYLMPHKSAGFALVCCNWYLESPVLALRLRIWLATFRLVFFLPPARHELPQRPRTLVRFLLNSPGCLILLCSILSCSKQTTRCFSLHQPVCCVVACRRHFPSALSVPNRRFVKRNSQ